MKVTVTETGWPDANGIHGWDNISVPDASASLRRALSLDEEKPNNPVFGKKTEVRPSMRHTNKETSMEPQEIKNRTMFWILKRHTSYTAWERAAQAFFTLYDAMAKVRPEFKNTHSRHYGPAGWPAWADWPMWDVMEQAKLHLENCLHKLRQGDKSVLMDDRWSSTPKETFSDWLEFIIGNYYQLVGMHPSDGMGDPIPIIPDQENITRLTLKAASLYRENIELSGNWALRYKNHTQKNVSSCEFISYSAVVRPSTRRGDVLYPIPSDLPPLPDPPLFSSKPSTWWAPKTLSKGLYTVKSGERIQRPGIYIDLVDNGLYYSPSKQEAPVREAPRTYENVSREWTLIWQDTRYEDGTIPEEEKLYFPD